MCIFPVARGGQGAIVRGWRGVDAQCIFDDVSRGLFHEERSSGGSKISMEKSISGDDVVMRLEAC